MRTLRVTLGGADVGAPVAVVHVTDTLDGAWDACALTVPPAAATAAAAADGGGTGGGGSRMKGCGGCAGKGGGGDGGNRFEHTLAFLRTGFSCGACRRWGACACSTAVFLFFYMECAWGRAVLLLMVAIDSIAAGLDAYVVKARPTGVVVLDFAVAGAHPAPERVASVRTLSQLSYSL